MTTDWRAYSLSAYICSRVEHDFFLALNTNNMAGPPDEPFSSRDYSNGRGAASSRRACGANSSLYKWWAAIDELDGGTGPSEYDGAAGH